MRRSIQYRPELSQTPSPNGNTHHIPCNDCGMDSSSHIIDDRIGLSPQRFPWDNTSCMDQMHEASAVLGCHLPTVALFGTTCESCQRLTCREYHNVTSSSNKSSIVSRGLHPSTCLGNKMSYSNAFIKCYSNADPLYHGLGHHLQQVFLGQAK